MTTRSWMGFALVGALSLGCSGRRANAPASTPPAPETVAPLSLAVLGASEGSVVESDAIDQLLDAPEVAAAGERLLDRLGESPELQPLYSGFLQGLMSQPSLLQAIQGIAAEDPSLSTDALQQRVEQRMSAGIDGPAFDAALDETLDTLFDRPDVDAAFGRLADALIERSGLVEQMTTLLLEWQPELEIAVGARMSDPDFEERFEAHLEERRGPLSELLEARVYGDPGLRQGLAAMLEAEDFFAACTTLVRGLLESPGFDASTTALVVGMLEQIDEPEMRRRVDRVLLTPAVEQTAVKFLDEVIASPAFDGFAQRLGTALSDPALHAELYQVIVGGGRPTA